MIENVLFVSLIGGIALMVLLQFALVIESALSFRERLNEEATWKTWCYLPHYYKWQWDWRSVFVVATPRAFAVGFSATFIGYTFLVGLTVVLGL